jgi:hypothetical protein
MQSDKDRTITAVAQPRGRHGSECWFLGSTQISSVSLKAWLVNLHFSKHLHFACWENYDILSSVWYICTLQSIVPLSLQGVPPAMPALLLYLENTSIFNKRALFSYFGGPLWFPQTISVVLGSYLYCHIHLSLTHSFMITSLIIIPLE